MADRPHVVVVGSGPAGAAAALTLADAGMTVTVLESGERFPGGLLVRAFGRTVARRRPSYTQPIPYRSGNGATEWFSDLVPGGLSVHWTGAVPRFSPEDFSEGERLDERYRWPIGYDDLVPYYEAMERLIGVVGDTRNVIGLPESIVRHRRALPRDWTPVTAEAAAVGQGLTATPLADGAPWLVRRSPVAFDSYTRVIEPLGRSAKLKLLRGAHAVELHYDPASGSVSAVSYADRATKEIRRLDADAFVIAAGPLASTKLLLDSTSSDFPGGLGDTHELLGRYLHDHVMDMSFIQLERGVSSVGGTAYLTRPPYESTPPLEAAQSTLNTGVTRTDKVRAWTPLKSKTLGVVFFGMVVPTLENFVRSSADATDDFGMPQLEIHLRFDERARSATAAARERLLAILEGAKLGPRITWSLPELMPGASAHYGGTVRMHSSPEHGVLDGFSRLHAVPNVVVADASGFTTGVEKNPTLTVMAIAARAADRLASDLLAA